MPNVDIVYKTYSGDFEFLVASLLSVQKFVKGFGVVYLVTDDELPALPETLSGLQIKVVKNPLYDCAHKQQGHPSAGYFNAMLVKLEIFDYLPKRVDRILMLDSDMLIKAEWDISKEPNKWFYTEWDNVPCCHSWKNATDLIFQSETKYSICSPGWFITKELCRVAIKTLETRFGKATNKSAFWANVAAQTNYFINEFQVLGNLLLSCPQSFNYELVEKGKCDYPVRTLWSWGGYEIVKSQVELLLGKRAPLDLVYKTYSGDRMWLWDSLRSVVKNGIGYGQIYILSDDNIGAIPSDLLDMPIHVIINPAIKQNDGYVNQILIKLSLFKYLPENVNRIFLIDSDMLFDSKIDFSSVQNKWFTRSWEKADSGQVWKQGVELLFDSPTLCAMPNPGWILTRHLMNCVLFYLCQRVGSSEVNAEFWQKLISKAQGHLSEFQILGNYLNSVHPLDYEVLEVNGNPYPIRQFRSWDGHDSVKAEIQQILNA